MFSGIVEGLRVVHQVDPVPPGMRLVVTWPNTDRVTHAGDSVAINGCCLTAVAVTESELAFDVGPETLQRTNLGILQPGDRVNVERSLRLGDAIGGHWVTGHIDAVGWLDERRDDRDWSTCWFRVPSGLTRQMASKGSVTVDGVSLTLVDVERERFSVALIPHTLQITTLGLRRLGDPVNLETDVLAKYVEAQLAAWRATGAGQGGRPEA